VHAHPRFIRARRIVERASISIRSSSTRRRRCALLALCCAAGFGAAVADDYDYSSAPGIGGVTVDDVTDSTATVRWTTDRPTSDFIDYGVTTAYDQHVTDRWLTTTHAVILDLLSPDLVYHFQITSQDETGLVATRGDFTFTTPEDTGRIVKLSPGGQSYFGPRVLQSAAKVTFRLDNGEIWVGDLNRSSGSFASGDGRNYRMDTGAQTGTTVAGPEFGLDASGWAVFYPKTSQSVVQTWRSRWVSNASAPEVLTTGSSHQTPIPTRSVTLSQTRLINLIGNWDQGGSLAWYQENTPTDQHVITQAKGNSTQRVPGRWLPDGSTLVVTDQTSGQLFLANTGNGQLTRITNDSGFKSTPTAWSAPEYDGATIIATVLDNTAIAIYRNLGGTYWTRVTTLGIPPESNDDVIVKPQPFLAGDKSYLALTIQDVVGTPHDGEIWIFDLEDDPAARYAHRCDDARSRVLRSNAEPFVGDTSAFVYYNAPNGSYQQMWMCRTDLVVTDKHPLVDTDVGRIQGVREGNTDAFLNIPYGKPPLGDLRWQQTVPAAPWSDVRVGNRMPTRCPQPDPDQPKTAIIGAEDCLYLNVWRPVDRSGALPVMVFVHGGGNRTGGTVDPISILLNVDDNEPLYDGTVLSDRGDVVVVTLEYRLAALGYLVDPALAAQSPTGTAGNYGLFDQLEALRWVQRNVAAFGGDPQRVMLFGQSGGSVDVSVLFASRRASGLFSRVLLESGVRDVATAEEAEAQDDKFLGEMQLLGVPDLLSRLRSLPLSKIVLAQSALPVGDDEAFDAWVDGYILDQQPMDTMEAGLNNDLPLIVGSDSAEEAGDVDPMTLDEFYDLTAQMVPPDDLAELYALYPLANYATPTDAYVAMTSDQRYTCPAHNFTSTARENQTAPVYRYYFKRQLSTNLREGNGAYHGTELLYLFQHMDGVHFPANDDDRTVEAYMLDYWTHFAAAGDPNNAGSPVWPLYDANADSYLAIDLNPAQGTHLAEDQCDFWATVQH
jgi:para-nitrobenzyl esterase